MNLYFDAQPSEAWTAFSEVRLTNYPNGAEYAAFPGQARGDGIRTEIADVNGTNPFGRIRWGAIVLERSYVQWRHSDWLQLRMGYFLTPFGIWNIDHGTPTLISLMLPQFAVTELFPTHQLGAMVTGSGQVGSWRVGYYGTVSNGRTTGQLDPTEDKMLGWRVTATRKSRYRLTFGYSGIWGRTSDIDRRVVKVSPVEVDSTEIVAYREYAMGIDVSLDVGALRLRAEMAHRQVRYEPGKRPLMWNWPGHFAPNNVETSGYVLAAYRLPWLGLEPYVYFEPYRWPTPLGEGMIVTSAGLNVYFSSVAQLKLQYTRQMFLESWSGLRAGNDDDGAHFLLLRAVVAF